MFSKKTIRIIAIIIIIAFMLTLLPALKDIFAQEVTINKTVTETVVKDVQGDKKEQPKQYKFSLDEAIKYAKEHNIDMIYMYLLEDDAKVTVENTYDTEEQAKDLMTIPRDYRPTDSFELYKSRNGYYTKAAKFQEEMIGYNKDLQEKSVNLYVEQAYYTLSQKRDTLELKNKTYDKIKTQIERSKKKYELGQISEIEFMQVQLQEDKAKLEVESAQAEYQKATTNFDKVLGLDLNAQIELTTKVSFEKYQMKSEDENLKSRIDGSVTIKQLTGEIGLAKEEKDLTGAYKGKTSTDYEKLGRTIQQKTNKIEKEKREITVNTKSVMLDISLLEKSLALYQKSIDLAKKVVDISKVKYETGMGTDTDVIDAEIALDDAQNKYIETIHNYKLLVSKFEKGL